MLKTFLITSFLIAKFEGVFDENRFWDVKVEYAKASPGAILCQYTVHNRNKEAATVTVLPQVWYR